VFLFAGDQGGELGQVGRHLFAARLNPIDALRHE